MLKFYTKNQFLKALNFSSQPSDDVVLMGRALEKLFLEKLNGMPVEEVEVPTKGKKQKSRVVPAGATSTRKRTTNSVSTDLDPSSSGDTIQNDTLIPEPCQVSEKPQLRALPTPPLPTPKMEQIIAAPVILNTSSVTQVNNSHEQQVAL